MPIRRYIFGAFLFLVCHQPAFGFPRPQWMGLPRSYVCERVTEAPVIDGKLDEICWQQVTWTDDFLDIQGPQMPKPSWQTRCALLWDQQYLYIAARLEEPQIQASLTSRDAVIYHDNDFEVFIDPDGNNHLYFELEINALNTVWDLLLIRPYRDGGPAVNAWDIPGLRTAVNIDGTLNDPNDRDEGWNVEIAIPWAALAESAGRACPPEAGHVWRMNFSRVQWRFQPVDGGYEKQIDPETGKSFPENNWVWSPQGLIAMHYPENWGEVVFSDPDFSLNPEHDSINIARALMDVYYAQQQWREDHGHFARTTEELESASGTLMKEWSTRIETAEGTIMALPYNWTFDLDATDDRFTAKLCTPRGVMTVDETGRLRRNPLHPEKDCSCLKSRP